MKKLPEKLKSHVINNDILREKINALIDYHADKETDVKDFCSVIDNNKFEPALPKDWGKYEYIEMEEHGYHCPLDTEPEGDEDWEADLGLKVQFDKNQDREVCILIIRRLIAEAEERGRIEARSSRIANLQEATNRAYAKGQENGKKQGRKEEREKGLEYVRKWREDSNADIDDLINHFK